MKFGLNPKGGVHQELIHAYVSSKAYISLKERSREQKINYLENDSLKAGLGSFIIVG